MKKTLIIGLVVVLMLGAIFALGQFTNNLSNLTAGNSAEVAPSMPIAEDRMANQEKMESASSAATVTGDKIIKNVSYQIRTKTYDEDVAFFQNLPKQFGGEIESVDQGVGYYTEADQRYYNVSYRIPTDKLTAFMQAVEDNRVIFHKSFNQYNVTDSYNQNEARLKTLLASQERYLALLNKAEAISDIIAIEQALTNVSSEIDWLSQQKDRYDKDIDYTAVSLNLIEVKASDALSGRQSFFGELRDAFLSGIATFFEGLRQLLILILRLWPILVLVGIGLSIYLIRRKKHKPTD